MSKEKKRKEAPPEPAQALNNPFLAARERLKQLVKPPPRPEPRQPPRPPHRPPSVPAPAPAAEGRVRESDEELFRREMWGVQKLPDRDNRAVAEPAPRTAPQRLSEDAEAYAELADLVEGNGPWDIADTDEYIEGLGPGMDRRLLQRLRKGDYAVQAHLDLHGLNREEARVKVEQFLQQSRTAGRRCVLVIHGRGINSKDQIPVLKEHLRIWLTRGRIARSVLCFATARPVDGGAGAVYVLLRKWGRYSSS